jgi:hypothetical protein
MGNKRWVHSVLKRSTVEDLVSKDRKSLRVEVYDGSPHLQILLNDKGNVYFKTLGRVRKDIFKRLDLVPMDSQPGYVNVSWYKFKEVSNG